MKKPYKKYVRLGVAEMRPVTDEEIKAGAGHMVVHTMISVSDADIGNGSPREGDMIARSPMDPQDKWLVAAKYFRNNFKEK